ncbi:putative quinol monooxygenase [uncultured Hymenobacter sp.]|uniref:putative quinol monooxygenase n=1 Tax=uncultured Hymenobacter sp. TaxID=170016 RepID=UPI0035CA11FA
MLTFLTTFIAKNQAASHQLAKLLAELKENTPAEPGNLSYESFSVADGGLVFYIKDSWESQEQVDLHNQQLTQHGYLAQVAELVAVPFESVRLTEI